MFKSVDHIGFAVRDIEEAISFYTRILDVLFDGMPEAGGFVAPPASADGPAIPAGARHDVGASPRRVNLAHPPDVSVA